MKFKIWKRELKFNLETKEIIYKDKIFTPAIRTYWDMKSMYKQSSDLKLDHWLYFMYRDVFFDEKDKKILRENKIRYDITIILPELIWKEYNKTYGHYHPKNSLWKKYQELYQVISWNAIYLQQSDNKNFFTITNSGQAVNMDEWFWHITINNTKKDLLIMANLVDETFDSTYDDYKKNIWWTYYLLKDWWEKNYNYKNELRLEEGTQKFDIDISIYDDFINNPKKFNYLH